MRVFYKTLILLIFSSFFLIDSYSQENSNKEALDCNSWLGLTTLGSKVTVGDLDISGNQLTIEATFNRTQPLNSGLYYGNLVSKHTDQNNVNYSLLPNGCELTTTNGYKSTFQTCVLDINKTYHVAMVYDGVSLKYYRNGILRSQVPCTGNIVNNNLLTTIGQVAGGGDPLNNQFFGVINEVRIWNVARTQTQLLTNMGAALSNPSAQTGLLAYYTFDNTVNKQGNTAWNGTLVGSASLNQTNPSCSLASDLCSVIGPPVVAVFNAPETVCANEPVNITNTSQNATNYYWNFCQANVNQAPIGTNLGNIGGQFVTPVFMDYVFDNGNYYGFLVNYNTGNLTRLNFGNSLLNAPTATNLGNFGGIIPSLAEGIQIVKNQGKWYAIIVAGYTPGGSTPRVLKVDFGTNITNLTPIATNWGNIGNLLQPVDLHVFEENGHWYGFTVNAENNTITRFDFTTSFDNTPTAVNLGNIGNLSYPTGIYAINDNGSWRVFIVNAGNNTRTSGIFSLTRLDFGTSLLNTPTGVNLGSLGNTLRHPRDLTIMKFCDEIVGFAVNGAIGSDDIVKMDFHNDLSSVPTAVSLGNTGNLNFPHSIAKIFRVDSDLYSFVTNVGNNTLTRLKFSGCNNSSFPNSSAQNPPPVTYSTPGVYNINLTVDEGLPTQTTFCKQVVVEDCTPDVIVDFNIPDTVCVNMPVTITNNSQNATSYYWNFCQGNINQVPTGTNLGNVGGILSVPVFMDYVFVNNNYYGFSVNFFPGRLVRLDFGNSLLNNPTTIDLGNFGGIIPNYAEGIQIVQNEGRWYAIMVGGSASHGVEPRVLKIDFGTNITSTTGVATNWGNLGNMAQPLDLHVFQDNNNWYGFTVNGDNSTITRFNFTNSFNNTPTAVNLGNVGNVSYPDGIYAIKDNNTWKVFITNGGNDSRTNGAWSLTRLDFGTSLLNTPTGVNLGNPGNILKHPRDLTIMKFCGDIIGFAVNGAIGSNDIVKINFQNDLNSIPQLTSLGNIGNLDFPVSISKIFREGPDLYTFVSNAANNTITRIKFAGCNNSSIPNSAAQNPPPITYNTPGIYSINLTVDDGLPTQTTFCKQVVVLDNPPHLPIKTVSICEGDTIKIGSSSVGVYLWNTGDATDSIKVHSNGIYWVETNRFGCTNRDSFSVVVKPLPVVDLGSDTIICNSQVIQLSAGNDGDLYLWNTGSNSNIISVVQEGDYYVTVTKNSCSNTDTISVEIFDPFNFDFNYEQDVCNPMLVRFNGFGLTTANSYWDFGDNNTANIPSISHAYISAGTYDIKYSVGNGICFDTLRKTITVDILNDISLVKTSDTTICSGTTKQLRTNSSLDFCWTPVTYLNDPNSPQPITSTPENITYYFTAKVTGTNLITNGNFSQGNSDFTSAYQYNSSSGFAEGVYNVGSNIQIWHAGMAPCGDHTSGNGNMMMINGATQLNVGVWSQTVAVQPNTNYAFSAWLQNITSVNPSQLQFSINNINLGNIFQANNNSCIWEQFYTVWNSGTATTAVISIVNQNQGFAGNDFALDDISFAPVFIKRDSVIITVDSPFVKTNEDIIVCKGEPVQLNTMGAQTYSWTPGINLSNTGIANPIASPVTSTQYIVTGTNANGCIAKDTVNVNIHPEPVVTISNDTTICRNTSVQLFVNGGTSYSWSPPDGLNNTTIFNPVASPTDPTKYYVTITDNNDCDYLDSVTVAIKPAAIFSINAPGNICLNDSLQLNASGGNIYSWQPITGANNPTIPNPKVSPNVTTDYTVTITETTCNESRSLSTRVTVLPLPNIQASSSNDIDCSNDRSQLLATGANDYTWTPGLGLNSNTIANPVARPAITTQYIVKGTDGSGCENYDTVIVNVSDANRGGYLMPNAFTPNGDGLNDCYGISFWGIIEEVEFSIYNRWGERIFHTTDPARCWDGTYKGVKQNPDVFVYMITAKTNCTPSIFRKGTFVLIR